ncbi:MAG TPA: DUF6476 family protein [Rhizomicrobium sp.]|nr:DUF6476 family protein [Rhizomicrobium sp.]
MSDIVSEPGASHRGLLALVIGLGVLFVIAFVVVVVLALTKHAPASRADAFALPRGAKVVAMESQPGRLILHLATADGDEVDIVDTADGHLVARIK